jgi:hypothetical protein
MIYKFKSQATGDLMMLGPQGDEMLRLLGREPAVRGIIEVDAMPAALAALEAAATRTSGQKPAPAPVSDPAEEPEAGVGLQQRLWPVIEMLRRAHAAGSPVVWGV